MFPLNSESLHNGWFWRLEEGKGFMETYDIGSLLGYLDAITKILKEISRYSFLMKSK